MAKYTGPKRRFSRREGETIFPNSKCDFEGRPYPPGEARQSRRQSEFGLQLREKQKLRRTYGLMERQFKRLYYEAARRKGNTGELLLRLLESRLDNVVFRMGFAKTRNLARQMVTHKHILVNGRRLNVPSYQVKEGDEISVAERARNQLRVQHSLAVTEEGSRPEWLEVDPDNYTGKVRTLPARTELPSTISEQLIVEFYSK